MSLDTFRNQVNNFQRVAFDTYDRLAATHQQALDWWVYSYDNTQIRDPSPQLQEVFFFPEVYNWTDDIVINQSIDEVSYTVPLQGWTAGPIPVNQVNEDRPGVIERIGNLVPRLPPALNRKQFQLVMEVYRKNPLTVDGELFFSAAHPKPDGKGTFSNVITDFAVANPGNLTRTEVRDLLERVKTGFSDIDIIQAELIDDDSFEGNLAAVVHNASHQTSFRAVKLAEKVGDEENIHRNSFKLFRDTKPTPGQENWIEFTLRWENGPRPAILVIDTLPELVTLDENKVATGFYGIGYKQIFGVKAFIPNSSLQVRL